MSVNRRLSSAYFVSTLQRFTNGEMPVSFVEFQVEYLAASLQGLPPGLYYTKLSPPKFLPKAALPCLSSVDWSCEFTDDASLTVELNKLVRCISTATKNSKWKVCFWTTIAGSENAVAKLWMVLSLAMAQEISHQVVSGNYLKRYYSFRGQALLDLNGLRSTIRDLPDGLVSMKDERWDSWAAAAEDTLKSGLGNSEPTGVHGDDGDPPKGPSTWPTNKQYQPHRPKWPWYGLDPPGPTSDSQVHQQGTRGCVHGMKGDPVTTSKPDRLEDAVVQNRVPAMPSSSRPTDLRSELHVPHQSVRNQKSGQQNVPKAPNQGTKIYSSSSQSTQGSAPTTSKGKQQQAAPLQHVNINELGGPERFDHLLSQGLVPTGPKSQQTNSNNNLHKKPRKRQSRRRPKFAPSSSAAFDSKPPATRYQNENAQQKDAEQEDAKQEDAQRENAEQADTRTRDTEQHDALQKNVKHEYSWQEDAQQEDAQQEDVRQGDAQQQTSPLKQETQPDTGAANRESLLPDGSLQNSPSPQDSAAPPSAPTHEQAEGRRVAISRLTLATERRNAQLSSHRRVDSLHPKVGGSKVFKNPYPFAHPGNVWNVPSYYPAEEEREQVDEAVDMSDFPLRWLPAEIWEEIDHLDHC
ncbi:Hypothetical predicted protein [Lecanosticta acicola]|uniref:Uncharacterized protein n=1 Tax=Lecanosticta acicola TaxID=111012 RepID=A0AAI8Z4X9_9PEZI|nr:Hypothetical predicted protein [Lecanosticta acicola]